MRSTLANEVLSRIMQGHTAKAVPDSLPAGSYAREGRARKESELSRNQTERNHLRLPMELATELKRLAARNYCSLNTACVWAMNSLAEGENTLQIRINGLMALLPQGEGEKTAHAAQAQIRFPKPSEYTVQGVAAGLAYGFMLRTTQEAKQQMDELTHRLRQSSPVSFQFITIVALYRWAIQMRTIEALEAEILRRQARPPREPEDVLHEILHHQRRL